MSEKEIKNIIQYWRDSSQHDYDTMLGLFSLKRYSDSLFYGHLVLEKILKALVVKHTGEHSLPIHNLLFLLQKSGVELVKEEIEFLSEANKFNIRARYPDYKLSFYKLCTLSYTKPRIEKIKNLHEKLCELLPKK